MLHGHVPARGGRKPVERAGPQKSVCTEGAPASERTVNGSVCMLGFSSCMCR